jgi:HAE1 family hydrophobic/amphiphilic exporter-1/multidrug efflux pump
MSRFFIHRPVFAIVLSVLILLVGALSLIQLPVAMYPKIAPPMVQVTINYPGASAETVEQSVAAAVEQEVNGAENMIYMSSKSTSTGGYTLQVTFAVGTDVDLASVDINNRVRKAIPKLPPEAVTAGVTVVKQSPDMLMVISLYAPDRSYDDIFLSNYASINILDAIARTPGVGSTMIGGQRDYAMRVWVQPDRLAKLGLTGADVAAAIKEQNQLSPSGAVGAPPAQKGLPFQYSVNVKGRLSDTREFENLVLRTLPDGSILKVKDVARTELAANSYASFARKDGVPSTLIIVYQLPGANSIQTAKELRGLMSDLGTRMPPGVKYDITYDTTKFVQASIEEVIHALRDAIILVVLVVFLFLGSFRATLIPMLAVPVSLVGTFAAFVPLGFSINTLTLFAIVLAVGIVVDDAIVVVEAVEHHIGRGLLPLEATEKAMEEVSGPVVAIALVLCAVFVPVAFMGGITGQLYRQFALTLSVAVLLSALVALTLTPALCRLILRPRAEMHGPVGWFLRGFNRCFDRLARGYASLVSMLVRRLALGLAVLAIVTLGAGGLAKILPTGFVPVEDQGSIFAALTLPDGASMERTDALVQRAESDIKNIPGVESVMVFGGLNLITGASSSNNATLIVTLKPWEERKTPETMLRALIPRFRQLLDSYPEAVSFVGVPPPIPGLGMAGGFTFELQDRGGQNPQALDALTRQFMAEASQRKEVVGLYSGFRTNVPRVHLDVDREKAKTLGVRVDAVFKTLQIYLGGLQVNDFNRFGKSYKVMVQAEKEYRSSPEQIGRLHVRSESGDMIPLSTLVRISPSTGPDLIQRYNMFRTAEITGSNSQSSSTGQALAAMEDVARKTLPAGYSYEWTGTAFQEKLAGSSQTLILAMGLLFMFLFLAAQYESWSIPLGVMLGLSIGVFGAFLALFLRLVIQRIPTMNDVYAQIGIVMLMGLAAKNAILIIEFAKLKHEGEGLPVREAAIEGAKLRFRPILMTSFAFILGVVPLVIASGAGAASRRTMGTAVFGGMIAATTLGIFIIPVLYAAIELLLGKFRKASDLDPSPLKEDLS